MLPILTSPAVACACQACSRVACSLELLARAAGAVKSPRARSLSPSRSLPVVRRCCLHLGVAPDSLRRLPPAVSRSQRGDCSCSWSQIHAVHQRVSCEHSLPALSTHCLHPWMRSTDSLCFLSPSSISRVAGLYTGLWARRHGIDRSRVRAPRGRGRGCGRGRRRCRRRRGSGFSGE